MLLKDTLFRTDSLIPVNYLDLPANENLQSLKRFKLIICTLEGNWDWSPKIYQRPTLLKPPELQKCDNWSLIKKWTS